jgi:hypothetical protein
MEFFDFFFKSYIWNVIVLKLSSCGVFHDLKHVKNDLKSLKIGQVLQILANFSQFL